MIDSVSGGSAGGNPVIHIFDIDYTLVRKSTSFYFLLEALREKKINFAQVRQLPMEWLRYKMGLPNLDFIDEAVKHLAGIDKTVLEDLAETCFTRRLKPNIFTGAAKLIAEIHNRGEQAFFATSSLHTLIKPLENYFGVSESIASVLEFSDGKTTGRLSGGSLFGKNKKTAVASWLEKRGLSPSNVYFYSDSYTDLPLLEFCGHPAAVNPDRFLGREAKKRGWEVLKFRETLG
jgi:HAD superfamily hydrolase (TIGR01490 family)